MGLDRLKEYVFYLAIIISINIYYYLYAIPFDQGLSNSVFFFVAAKCIVCILIILSLEFNDIKPNPKLFFFGIMLLVLYSVGLYMRKGGDTLFLNYLNFALLLALVNPDVLINRFKKSFFIISYIMVGQVVLDLLLVDWLSLHLWNEGQFVGGTGNPSTFAFFCLFSFVWIVFSNLNTKMKYIIGTILLYGVVRSYALFMYLLIILDLLILLILIPEKRKQHFKWIVISSLVLVYGRADYLLYKIKSVLYFLGFTEKPFMSDSVTARVRNYKAITNEGVAFINFNYVGVDSQYITALLSFGIIGAILLFYPIFEVGFLSIKNRKKINLFLIIMVLNFLLIFFNNRILDYYPVSYIYISILLLVAAKLKNQVSINEFSVNNYSSL